MKLNSIITADHREDDLSRAIRSTLGESLGVSLKYFRMHPWET